MFQTVKSRTAFFCIVTGASIPLAAHAAGGDPGPCKQIVETCLSAGFVKGDAKLGYGLSRDCIVPIMRGTGQPPNAIKPLPPVPPELVAACRQRHPKFGEGT